MNGHDGNAERVVSCESSFNDHRLLLLFSGSDLLTAYGRFGDILGAHHELFLRGALRTGSPTLSFTNGLQSIADHAEQFELLVVSLPSIT